MHSSRHLLCRVSAWCVERVLQKDACDLSHVCWLLCVCKLARERREVSSCILFLGLFKLLLRLLPLIGIG